MVNFLLLFFCTFALSTPPPTSRRWSAETSENHLQLVAQAKNSTYQDELQFSMRTSPEPSQIFSADFFYISKAGTNRSSMHFQFSLGAVVEYESNSPTETYNDSSVVVSRYPSAKHPWSAWSASSQVIDGVTLYQWETTDQVINLRVRVVTEPLVTPTFTWDPNFVKFDVDIANYHYDRTNNTRLGLATTLNSQTKVKFNTLKANKFLFNDDAGLPSGLVSWIPYIEINNRSSVPVITTSLETKASNYHIYYTILTPSTTLHPSFLSWDPLLGLQYAVYPPTPEFCMGNLCGPGAYGVVVAIVVISVVVGIGILMTIKRQRRKRRISYSAING